MPKPIKKDNGTTAAPLSKSKASFPKITPKSHLHLEELEHNQIYIIPNYLNQKECDSMLKYFEDNLPPQPAPTAKPKKGYAFRNNDRQQIQDESIAQLLWSHLQPVVEQELPVASGGKKPKGLNSNIRVYRYRKGHSFGAHYDESVQDKGLWTDWTLLIYLNEDMEGGETVFYREGRHPDPPQVVVQPKKGLALLHRHGTHCLLHEAKEVTCGSKWVLRSDVLVG